MKPNSSPAATPWRRGRQQSRRQESADGGLSIAHDFAHPNCHCHEIDGHANVKDFESALQHETQASDGESVDFDLFPDTDRNHEGTSDGGNGGIKDSGAHDRSRHGDDIKKADMAVSLGAGSLSAELETVEHDAGAEDHATDIDVVGTVDNSTTTGGTAVAT